MLYDPARAGGEIAGGALVTPDSNWMGRVRPRARIALNRMWRRPLGAREFDWNIESAEGTKRSESLLAVVPSPSLWADNGNGIP